jgi:hypothetical protein
LPSHPSRSSVDALNFVQLLACASVIYVDFAHLLRLPDHQRELLTYANNCGLQDSEEAPVRRHLIALSTAVTVAGLAALPAATDPGHAKNASHVQAMCGTQTVNVIVNGNGKFTPAHVVGSTKMFIPTALHLTFTFTPTNGQPATTNTQNAAKASPTKRGTVTCTIPMQTLNSGPQGSTTIQGSVTGFFTPAKHA